MFIEYRQVEIVELAVGKRRTGHFENPHCRRLSRFDCAEPAAGIEKATGNRIGSDPAG